MPRRLSLDDFGHWSPRIVYGLALRGVVAVSVPTARALPLDSSLAASRGCAQAERCDPPPHATAATAGR